MDKKCSIPQNIVDIEGKRFILASINPNLILGGSGPKKPDAFPDNSLMYQDDVACKVNLPTLKPQKPSENEAKREKSSKAHKEDEYTHFLSIPLTHLSEKIYALQSDCQKHCYHSLDDNYVDCSLTHITLCMLSLHTAEEKEKAAKVLKDNEQEIRAILSDNTLSLKGLDYFGGRNKNKANIVYLKLEENTAFQAIEKLVDFLVKKMIGAGVLKESQLSYIIFDKNSKTYKSEKFHITLLRARNNPIDVSGIMKELGNINLGKCEMKTVDISTRFDYDEENFYRPLHRLHLKK